MEEIETLMPNDQLIRDKIHKNSKCLNSIQYQILQPFEFRPTKMLQNILSDFFIITAWSLILILLLPNN